MLVHALIATLCAGALAQDTPADAPKAPADDVIAPSPETNFVAVVVGLSSYDALPDAVELDFARSDAALVNKLLKSKANFTHTFLVTDGEATRENLRDLLRTEVAQVVGPNDVFLLYFVGHGIGADLDEPSLLVYDSVLDDSAATGLELNEFATDLTTWAPAGVTLIVTDAIHRNQLDGVYFFGPAANQWPSFAGNVSVISSSQADSPARDGAFGTVFADAISGSSDANGDGFVTLGELETYLADRITPMGQIPVRAPASVPAGTVIAQGVHNEGATDPSTTTAPIPAKVAEFPDTEVWSAKFVFRQGASQSVHCHDEDVKACAPSCYVRNFKAGICELKAVVDGVELTGRVPVVYPGKYSCGLRAGSLTCRPPLDPAPKRDE